MGLEYLGGKSWREISRDERFFCSHLYALIEKNGATGFVAFLNSKENLGLDPAANWEPAFEACFYRDIWNHRNKQGELISPKRTFDLCLFSDDAIVIIEAKAHDGFSEKQMASFDDDEKQVEKLTEVKSVVLLALVSSKYQAKPETKKRFKGWLEWNELAALYGRDRILQRANDVYKS
ncbi:MAG: PD-(D/E)XK nuclease family protein [Spirochaetales bacterium]|nr:PD-(D/E)XK nuclease family protein [Spirochaetales bacterium]